MQSFIHLTRHSFIWHDILSFDTMDITMDIPTMKNKVDKKINEKSGKQEHATFCYTKDQLAEIMNRF